VTGRVLIIIDRLGNFFFYLVLFIYGFVIFRMIGSDVRSRDHRKSALMAGIITSLAYLIITFAGRTPVRGTT